LEANELKSFLAPPAGRNMGAILHVGAGEGANLQEYLAARPGRLMLVEAQAANITALERQVRNRPNVQVIHAAIADRDTTVTLNGYVGTGLASVLPATGLKAAYGKHNGQVTTAKVPGMTMATILKALDAPRNSWNVAIIEAPGMEQTIANVLRRPALGRRFESIVMKLSRKVLFEGAAPGRATVEAMRGADFELLDCWPSDDPAWQWYRFGPNVMRLQYDEAQKALASAEERLGKGRDEVLIAEGQISIIRDLIVRGGAA